LVGVGFRCWLAGYDTGDIACWETGWNAYARTLGAKRAKRAVTELACWVRAVRASASRKIEDYPFGCAGFCPDEVMAVSLIAASRHARLRSGAHRNELGRPGDRRRQRLRRCPAGS